MAKTPQSKKVATDDAVDPAEWTPVEDQPEVSPEVVYQPVADASQEEFMLIYGKVKQTYRDCREKGDHDGAKKASEQMDALLKERSKARKK